MVSKKSNSCGFKIEDEKQTNKNQRRASNTVTVKTVSAIALGLDEYMDRKKIQDW